MMRDVVVLGEACVTISGWVLVDIRPSRKNGFFLG